jgi:hypothetical protein
MKESVRELLKSNINALAIWEEDSMKMPDVDSQIVDKLFKPHIIFLGLNPSKSLKKIRNFHSSSAGDKRLKSVIHGSAGDEDEKGREQLVNLIGGFMTDLMDKVESDSSKVDLKDHSFNQIEYVLQELSQEHYHLICFGGKTYEAAKNWLLNQKSEKEDVLHCQTTKKPYEITLYRVMHYSYRYGENKVGKQLNQINERIGRIT